MISSVSFLLAQATPAAPAATDPDVNAGGFLGNGMFMPIIMFVMVYFLFLRPMKKRQQEQDAVQKAAKQGDRVVTASGIHGTIVNVKEGTLILEIAEKVRIEIEKSAIAAVKSKPEAAKS